MPPARSATGSESLASVVGLLGKRRALEVEPDEPVGVAVERYLPLGLEAPRGPAKRQVRDRRELVALELARASRELCDDGRHTVGAATSASWSFTSSASPAPSVRQSDRPLLAV
jgi:hypothetical protein